MTTNPKSAPVDPVTWCYHDLSNKIVYWSEKEDPYSPYPLLGTGTHPRPRAVAASLMIRNNLNSGYKVKAYPQSKDGFVFTI